MSEVSAAMVRIEGRVQGVWFRASTKEEAERLGLVGWAKNMEDGSVQALFQGPKPLVEQAISWCRIGPPLARVSDVLVEWVEPEPDRVGFRTR